MRTGNIDLANVNDVNINDIVKTNNNNYIIDLYFNSDIENIKEVLDKLPIINHGYIYYFSKENWDMYNLIKRI